MWTDPLAWTIALLLGHALATNVAWVLDADPSARRRLGPLASLAEAVGGKPDARRAVAGLYLLGVPAMAVALHVVRPSLMGLAWPASARSAALAAGLGALALVVLLAADAWLAVALGRAPDLRFTPPGPRRLGDVALDALFAEAHWAFFRAAALSSGLASTTLAVFLALGLLAVEAWSSPGRRAALDHPDDARGPMRAAGLAVLSALVFLVTGSSGASLVVHIAVAAGLEGLGGGRLPVLDAPAQAELASVEPTVV